jgi:hypothetical protein
MQEQTTTNAIDELKPWFHNLHLPNSAQTVPEHPMGDFPSNKWMSVIFACSFRAAANSDRYCLAK